MNADGPPAPEAGRSVGDAPCGEQGARSPVPGAMDDLRRSPTDEVITGIWRRAVLLAVVLLVLTVALVVALKLTHTASGPPATSATSTAPR